MALRPATKAELSMAHQWIASHKQNIAHWKAHGCQDPTCITEMSQEYSEERLAFWIGLLMSETVDD